MLLVAYRLIAEVAGWRSEDGLIYSYCTYNQNSYVLVSFVGQRVLSISIRVCLYFNSE